MNTLLSRVLSERTFEKMSTDEYKVTSMKTLDRLESLSPQLRSYIQTIHVANWSAHKEVLDGQEFENAVSIIMELRQAILNTVLNQIPKETNKPIILLVGITGSGKSTTFCYLRGDQLRFNDDNRVYSSDDHEGLISHSLTEPATMLPNIVETEKAFLIDFPGFQEGHCTLIDTAVSLALYAILQTYSVKLLQTLEFVSELCQMKSVDNQRLILDSLITDVNHSLLLLTRYQVNHLFWHLTNRTEQLNSATATNREKLQEEIRQYQQKLQETKVILQEKTGTQHCLEFRDLTDTSQLGAHWQTILDLPNVNARTKYNIQASVSDLLEKLFSKTCVGSLCQRPANTTINKTGFESKVSENGLFHTLVDSNTQLADFLLLPEVQSLAEKLDHTIINNYDHQLFRKYICALSNSTEKTLLRQFGEKPQEPQERQKPLPHRMSFQTRLFSAKQSATQEQPTAQTDRVTASSCLSECLNKHRRAILSLYYPIEEPQTEQDFERLWSQFERRHAADEIDTNSLAANFIAPTGIVCEPPRLDIIPQDLQANTQLVELVSTLGRAANLLGMFRNLKFFILPITHKMQQQQNESESTQADNSASFGFAAGFQDTDRTCSKVKSASVHR